MVTYTLAMRLLYVTESMPNRDPVFGDGSSMIPYEFLRNLPEDIAVTLVTFSGPVGLPDDVRERCESVHILAPRSRTSAFIRSFFGLNGLGKQERSTAKAKAITSKLSKMCDATLIHGPHALPLARHVQGPMVLQTVDPWSIRAGMDTAIAKKLRPAYRLREHQALRAERRLPAAARLLTVAAKDATAWSSRLGRTVRSIPNGAEQGIRPANRQDGPVVCFVGSLNYGPNIDSAGVLINKIAPLVWQRVPDTRFVIAGRRPPPSVLNLAGPRVDVLANVPSVLEIFHGADVAVFPDEHGVGIRNSVREALAAGTPVVATPVAAREQEPHPLLSVEEDVNRIAERVVGHLTGSRTGRSTAGPSAPDQEQPEQEKEPVLRTWKDVTQEYLGELHAAISQNGHHQQRRTSTA